MHVHKSVKYSTRQKKVANTVYCFSVLMLIVLPFPFRFPRRSVLPFGVYRSPFLPFHSAVPFHVYTCTAGIKMYKIAGGQITGERVWKNREMPYSAYLKRRALFFRDKGLTPCAIIDALAEEGLLATRQGLTKFFKRFEETGTLGRR